MQPESRDCEVGVPVPVKVAKPLTVPEVAVMLLDKPQAVEETTVASPDGLMVTQLIVVEAQDTEPVMSPPV